MPSTETHGAGGKARKGGDKGGGGVAQPKPSVGVQQFDHAVRKTARSAPRVFRLSFSFAVFDAAAAHLSPLSRRTPNKGVVACCRSCPWAEKGEGEKAQDDVAVRVGFSVRTLLLNTNKIKIWGLG